jgi:hypothetical protein
MDLSIRVGGAQFVNQIFKIGCLSGHLGCFLGVFR